MALQDSSFPSSSSSSPSSLSYAWPYDVFLSFRGSDTRHNFTGNLYKALTDKGVHTFIDDEELHRGEEITPALVKAIQDSRIAIVVFSVNYASSSFCLHELATIMECVKGMGRLVLPVFYDVDPCDVRHQRGSYGEAMAKHEVRFKDDKEKVQKWKEALYQVANLSGEDFRQWIGYEYVFIEKLAKEISNKINHVPLHVADYPVGLMSRVLEVNSLLNDGFDGGVLMIGIHGIGGIGKTTLARALYNLIADQFEGLCFLENVRENSIELGLIHLQEKLLSEILGDKDIKLGSINQGIPIIKHRLHRKKILLVVDDVNKPEQLQAIVGGVDWFGSGSRVIITTRDKHLLASHGIERKYEAGGLSMTEALALLSWNAFKCESIDRSYMDILRQVVSYACGLPLALEVIGSNLFGKSIEKWRSALDQYKRIPNKEIQKILKISFDDLEEYQQKLFLDIACYSKGHNWIEVKGILARHDVCPAYGISVLVQKSLIKINKFGGYVTLHDLIRDMGREIVRQESPKHPGKRSRLWLPKDVIQVLEDNTGTSKIEIMILDVPEVQKVVVEWDGKAFKKMKNLEILIIRGACFSRGAKHLPNSLIVLEWWNYPSNSLPLDFHPKELAIFKLPYSSLMSIKFLTRRKFVNLKVLKLDNSNIEQIPDVSSVPNLEELSFRDCGKLIKVHESIGFLDKLYRLGVTGCSKLKSFPALMLPLLGHLDFSRCSSLEKFPEILGDMENLTGVCFYDTSIKELPHSFANLRNLENLAIGDVHGMLSLPSSIGTLPSLLVVEVKGSGGLQFPEQDIEEEKGSLKVSSAKFLSFKYCNVLDEFVAMVLALFRNVVNLDLSKNYFTSLPESIKNLCSLRKLTLDNCEKLGEIRGIPPNIESFSAVNCISLSPSSRSMLLNQELHSSGCKTFHLPGSGIPKWFEHNRRSNSISFWFRNKLPSISLCVVAVPTGYTFSSYISIKLIINGKEDNGSGGYYFNLFDPVADHITIIDQIEILSKPNEGMLLSKNEWNHVVCRVMSGRQLQLIIKEIGINVLRHKNDMEEIRFTYPLLQKKEVNIGDFQRKMEQQKNLALLKMYRGTWLSHRLALETLNDYVNGDSNSVTFMQTSSSTNIQGTMYEARGLRKQGLKAFRDALDIDPGHVPCLFCGSFLRRCSNQSNPTVRSFQMDALLCASAWYNLGLLGMAEGTASSLVEAAECFQRAHFLEKPGPAEPFR